MTGCTRNDSTTESMAKKAWEVVPAPISVMNDSFGLEQEEFVEKDTEAALNKSKPTGSVCASLNGIPCWSSAVISKRVHWPVEALAGPETATVDSTGAVAASATTSLAPPGADTTETPVFAW